MDIFAPFASEKNCCHIFHQGKTGMPLYRDRADFERFLALLHIGNDDGHFILHGTEAMDVFSSKHSSPLVNICAYCLLPDRYHLILSDQVPNGIQRFIHKIDTAYVMYYNNRYSHRGTIFSGKYRSKRILTRCRLYECISRVHVCPFSAKGHPDLTVENGLAKATECSTSQSATRSEIKADQKRAMEKAVDRASRYEYSSMKDYLGEDRPQKAILTR